MILEPHRLTGFSSCVHYRALSRWTCLPGWAGSWYRVSDCSSGSRSSTHLRLPLLAAEVRCRLLCSRRSDGGGLLACAHRSFVDRRGRDRDCFWAALPSSFVLANPTIGIGRAACWFCHHEKSSLPSRLVLARAPLLGDELPCIILFVTSKVEERRHMDDVCLGTDIKI